MSLRAQRIALRDFRNHPCVDIDLDNRATILVGRNGAGKTNVLEALYLLTTGRLLRGGSAADLVAWGAETARAELECREQGSAGAPGAGAPRTVTADINHSGTKTYSVNGTVRRRRADVFGQLPSIVFSPEDMALAKGPAEARRTALDALGEQLSATYGSLRKEYERTLRQRNTLLKEAAPSSTIDVWTMRLVETGARLVGHRLGLLERVSAAAEEAYSSIAPSERLVVFYEPSWMHGRISERPKEAEQLIAEAMTETLSRRQAEELARGMTLAGPHRDDIVFELDGHDARTFGSQGQQRTIALAWKLAEVKAVETIARSFPLLLLDDVMSELDESRRHTLTALVSGKVQTVLTTTNLRYFEDAFLRNAKVVNM